MSNAVYQVSMTSANRSQRRFCKVFTIYIGMTAILFMSPWPFEKTVFPPTHGGSIYLALIGPVASEEMFENVDIRRMMEANLFIQFYTDHFETLHMFSPWSEDVHVFWIYIILVLIFVTFSTLRHFLTSDSMKVYRQWVPCERNSSYNFKTIFLKLCTCF